MSSPAPPSNTVLVAAEIESFPAVPFDSFVTPLLYEVYNNAAFAEEVFDSASESSTANTAASSLLCSSTPRSRLASTRLKVPSS